MSSLAAGGGWSRRGGGGGGRFDLPRQLQPPPVVVDVGCTCRRAPRLLLSSLISSLKSHARGVGKPNKFPQHASSSSWSSSATTAFTSSTSTTTTSSLGPIPATCAAAATANNAIYDEVDDAEHAMRPRQSRQRRRRRRSRCGRAAAAAVAVAVAVEVESTAPYEDFRESMVEMVTEKEMYAWEDLDALLRQFLALNSPRHHRLILAAFADLWAPRGGPFCPPSPCL